MRLNDGKEICRVLIVDDDPAARDSYAYPIEDLELKPLKVPGPVEPVSFVAKVGPSDVVVCDYHLRRRSYSSCDGDELLVACYKAGIPGMLCTSYTDVDATIPRRCLRFIPSLLRTNSPEPEEFVEAWEKCQTEMNGIFHPTRRPWRSLVRVEEVDNDRECFYAVVSSWDVHKKIRIDKDSVPKGIRKLLQPGRRFHAQVNTGAESHEDLFFVSWEER